MVALPVKSVPPRQDDVPVPELARGLPGVEDRGVGGDAAARVLDVSSYPEINDLILAADAAVLDYSSLRFDFALTGKPMVFLVPDLETYSGASRGFLYPFTESAPGPLVATTDEVIDLLRDLDGLRTATSTDLAAFNATYNTWHDGAAAARVVDALLGGTGAPG